MGRLLRAADAPVDVLLPHDYRCDGLRVHREGVDPDEVTWLGPTPVTTPARAAFDLARWAPDLTERVVAVDALAHFCKVDPDAIRTLRNRHLGVHHGAEIAEVLALADARAESPMESRMRMALHLGGLPAPSVQHPVIARGARYLGSRLPAGPAGDRVRRRGAPQPAAGPPRSPARSGAHRTGWHILRFDADVVLFRPDRLVQVVRAELAARGVLSITVRACSLLL